MGVVEGGNYRPGDKVVTRRGKRGTVTAAEGTFHEGTVTVSFGGREFDMRPGQLVLASSYDRMRPHANNDSRI